MLPNLGQALVILMIIRAKTDPSPEVKGGMNSETGLRGHGINQMRKLDGSRWFQGEVVPFAKVHAVATLVDVQSS